MTIPKIYVAAPSAEIDRAKHWMAKLREEGFVVTYDWTVPVEKFGSAGTELRDIQLRAFARRDLEGIDDCDLLWLLAPIHGATIGAWWEGGYAQGTRKTIVISPPISGKLLFAMLPTVHEYDDDEKAFEFIQRF